MNEKCPFCGRALTQGRLKQTIEKKPIYSDIPDGTYKTGRVLIKGKDFDGFSYNSYTVEKEKFQSTKRVLIGHEDQTHVEKYIGCDDCGYKLKYTEVFDEKNKLQPSSKEATIEVSSTNLTAKDVVLKFFTAKKTGGVYYTYKGAVMPDRLDKKPWGYSEDDYDCNDDTRYFFTSKLKCFEGFYPKNFDPKTIYEEELEKWNAKQTVENKKRIKKLAIIGSVVAAILIFAFFMYHLVIVPSGRINAETVFLQADKLTANVGEEITLTVTFTPDDATHVGSHEITAEGNIYNCEYRFTENNIEAKINNSYEVYTFTKKQTITVSAPKAGTVKLYVKVCRHSEKHDGLKDDDMQSEEITLTFV